MIELYGITGRKGHGKDTLARLIAEADPGFIIVHFADALKQMASRIFEMPENIFYDNTQKEQLFSTPIKLDNFITFMRSETGLEIQPIGLSAVSPRELMQLFGTEYVRKARENFWTQILISDITCSRHNKFIVSDVRFPDEMKAIKGIGGKIIKVVKTDAPIETGGHASEAEVDNLIPDLLIGVKIGDINLLRHAADLIVRGCFRYVPWQD